MERTLERGVNTDSSPCARDRIQRMQKKKKVQTERGNDPSSLDALQSATAEEQHQYNLSSDQHSHCSRRLASLTQFSLGCFVLTESGLSCLQWISFELSTNFFFCRFYMRHFLALVLSLHFTAFIMNNILTSGVTVPPTIVR